MDAFQWLLEGPLAIRGVCNIFVAYSKELQGLLLHQFKCPSKRLVMAEVPGCDQVVCGTDDGFIFEWDVVTNQRLMFGHHAMWISAIAVMPDSTLAVGGWAGDVHIWVRNKGHVSAVQLHTLKGHTNCIDVFIVLPNGQLVSGSSDDTMRVWDVGRGTCTHTLEGHTGAVRVLTLLPDAKMASGSVDRTVRVWDTAHWTCLQTLDSRNSVCSVVAMSAGWIASGSSDGTVRVWDLSAGVCVRVCVGHVDSVWSLAVLPDGALVSGSGDRSVRVWKRDGGCMHTLKHKASVYQLVVLPDGRFASYSADKTVRIWDGSRCVEVLQHPNKVVDLKMLANGLLLSACSDGTVCAWQ